MLIDVKGANPTQKKYITSVVKFCAKKLMPRMYNLHIKVHLKSLQKDDVYGYCLADPDSEAERSDRPRVFEIEVHKHMRMRRLLETICHEMVHAKQYARGELYEVVV